MIELIERYLKPHRHFHNIEHIANMIRRSIVYDLEEKDSISLKYAIYYHDYVYDPMSDTNEKDSSLAFITDLMNNKIENYDCINSMDLGAIVMLMIQDTYNHIPTTRLSKYLIDLDLWELADIDKFDHNRKLVRKEYTFIDNETFNLARINWINSMLKKKQIYYTDYCIDNHFENEARNNLNLELHKRIRGLIID